LVGLGGLTLERVVTSTIIANFDVRLEETLGAMVAAAELDPYGEVRFNRPPVEPRFNEPYSGLYWQVSAKGHDDFRSRSLWDRDFALDLARPCVEPCASRKETFENEPLRLVERDIIIPGSDTVWRFAVAENASRLDQELVEFRRVLWLSLGALGIGLILLSGIQATVGLSPLKRMSAAMADIRAGRVRRAPTEDTPPEIAPLVQELNALLDHNEQVAEAARMHAGNLAHALKTPMSVLVNEAGDNSPDLAETVRRELAVMRRHIDHHLARARAMGRRTAATARAEVWPTLERLQRAIERIYADRPVLIDISGDRMAAFRGERQDLEEMVGNLIDNAAKYGGGRVFVTVSTETDAAGDWVSIMVEDDGRGIPKEEREALFARGARLDTGKPGTGLGLAIVRDVAGIYGGSVRLESSEGMGGLAATLRLPACPGSAALPAPARRRSASA
jgi:signal transduction histidine kinase